MKRLLSALSPLSSDEIEPVIKRARLLITSQPSVENISFNSQSEHDDNDIIEIIHENINNTCQPIDDEIITILDSDLDDDDISSITVPSPSISAETVEEEEIDIENDHELIDLTEDESNSTCCLSDKLERKSSIDVEQCPICLETLSDLQYIGVYLITTQCHHIMCTLCSRQLLATSSRCPLCRQEISSTTLTPYCILT